MEGWDPTHPPEDRHQESRSPIEGDDAASEAEEESEVDPEEDFLQRRVVESHNVETEVRGLRRSLAIPSGPILGGTQKVKLRGEKRGHLRYWSVPGTYQTNPPKGSSANA